MGDEPRFADIVPGSRDDKILGMIYGHALGDAVGLETEFKFAGDLEEITFPRDYPIRDFPVCDWTDDTDHLIIVMQSLTAHRGKINSRDIAKRLKSWSTNGFPELGDTCGAGLGGSTSLVLHHKMFLENPELAAAEIWNNSGRKLAPNGSLMRTSILGALPDLNYVVSAAVELSRATHFDPRCVAACVFQSVLIHHLIHGSEIKSADYVDVIVNDAWRAARPAVIEIPDIEFGDRRHQPTPKAYHNQKFKTREEEMLYWIDRGYNDPIKSLNLDDQVKRGFVFKCLGCSVYVIQMISLSLEHGRTISFKKVISQIALEAGDADTNCAVAGATLGAYLGYSKLPKDWIAALPNSEWLNGVIMGFIAELKN